MVASLQALEARTSVPMLANEHILQLEKTNLRLQQALERSEPELQMLQQNGRNRIGLGLARLLSLKG